MTVERTIVSEGIPYVAIGIVMLIVVIIFLQYTHPWFLWLDKTLAKIMFNYKNGGKESEEK